MADPKTMRCTGQGCKKRSGCPFFQSRAVMDFDPPDGDCHLYDGSNIDCIVKTLTPEQHKEIKGLLEKQRALKLAMRDLTCHALARRYNVSHDTIYRIRRACRL